MAFSRQGQQTPIRVGRYVPRFAMVRGRGHFVAVTFLCVCGWCALPLRGMAEAPTAAPAVQQPAAAAVAAPNHARAREMTAQIDQALAEAWLAAGIEPTVAADDAEFMRRVYLDLAGKIPSVAQSRAFLSDTGADNRERLIDQLLASAICASHFANTWRDTLLSGTNPELRVSLPELESWLRLRFTANTPYNQLVAELVSSSSALPTRRGQPLAATIPSPIAFFQANERKPESIAASLSSVFLGVQVECAQCHDHPFAKWKQEDFWSLAAFFRGLDGPNTDNTMMVSLTESFDRGGLKIPGTETVALPKYLDGSVPTWRAEIGNRTMLAQWMTDPQNPFFARAAVNRVWEQFFGKSLSAPADAVEAPDPRRAQLVDQLAEQFIATRFDLKQLMRGIALSRAYQLSSKVTTTDADLTAQFACMPVRRMTADQLFDSLVQATGFYEAPPPRNAQPFQADSVRVDFRNKFAAEGRQRSESQTTIVQALTLMNGKLVGDATSVDRSKTLTAIRKIPFVDAKDRVDMLFLATLCRMPHDDETAEFLAYVKAGDQDGRLADVLWVLLNSAEFVSNH
jgi:Protein of unknown function (DUF1549)/Protein of unknown function (DUF1553)